MVNVPVQFFKVLELPEQPVANAWYLVANADGSFAEFVTGADGVARPAIGNRAADNVPRAFDFPASLAWVINHNRGRYPAGVLVMSPGGLEILAEVQHVSVNQCVVRFAAANAGRAIVF